MPWHKCRTHTFRSVILTLVLPNASSGMLTETNKLAHEEPSGSNNRQPSPTACSLVGCISNDWALRDNISIEINHSETEENHIAYVPPKRCFFHPVPVMSCLDFSFSDCSEICSLKSVLEVCTASRGEDCTGTYPALRDAQLAAAWLVRVGAAWLDCLFSAWGGSSLLFQDKGSGCWMFNWASVTLWRNLYGCTLNRVEACKTMLPQIKNGKQKGCLQCVAFFPQIIPFWG